jgi:large subunit ribosomal protein L25
VGRGGLRPPFSAALGAPALNHRCLRGDFMATRVQLHAEPRELLGKKVRRLRRQGILPATLYGQDRSVARSIQLQAHELAGVLRQAGTTQLIDLVIEKERPRPVFIRQTTVDPKRNSVIHVEFFQANLREKTVAHVPLHFAGESQAVKDGGIFLHILDHLDVECLPQDVPAGIDVDISRIEEINGTILAGDVQLPSGLTLITPGDEIVCKVNPPVAEAEVEEILEEPAELPEELGGEEEQPEAAPEE